MQWDLLKHIIQNIWAGVTKDMHLFQGYAYYVLSALHPIQLWTVSVMMLKHTVQTTATSYSACKWFFKNPFANKYVDYVFHLSLY